MRQLKEGAFIKNRGCHWMPLPGSEPGRYYEWHPQDCSFVVFNNANKDFFYEEVEDDDVELEKAYMNIWINTPEVKEKIDSFLKDSTDPFNIIVEKIKELHNKKRADYTGGKHILYNYKTAAEFVGLDTYKLILTRIIEKCLRLSVIHENGGTYQVEDEKPDDTSRDIAVLAILLEIARHDSEATV